MVIILSGGVSLVTSCMRSIPLMRLALTMPADSSSGRSATMMPSAPASAARDTKMPSPIVNIGL